MRLIRGGLKILILGVMVFCIIIEVLFCSATLWSGNISNPESKTIGQNLGIWVTVFSEKRVLYSKKATQELIDFCKRANINEIYLQLYRADQAYYDSRVTDGSRYEAIIKSAGMDTLDFLLREAQRNKIKVFAWMNILSLGQNKQASIIKKFGDSVLTRDQYGRVSMRSEAVNESDKYYLRDEQLFLEPGDPRVVDYVVVLAKEILERYPLLSGIHLDYIRYPHPVPFIPGSRFNQYGLTYGYGEKNIERFRQKTGFGPFDITNSKDNFLSWDNWRREQVTGLVRKISHEIRHNFPGKLVSAAVIPAPERAYSIAFQDWPLWLEEGIVDYVVIMNYTPDQRLAKENAISALAFRGKGKIYVGIGLFLMKNEPKAFGEQYKIVNKFKPDGIVLFSYDDINEDIIRCLPSDS